MKNISKIVFIVTILLLFSLPIIFFNSKQTVSETEKRNLAVKPNFLIDGHFNDKMFFEYNDYFQDHLGFREQLIKLDANNPLKMKSPVMEEKAIAGKDGWYFYINPIDGNNLLDFYKRNLFDEFHINQFSQRVQDTVEWCNEQNIKCIFLIGPNKHSVYEEYYPFERPEGITRADQITQIFDEIGVNYVFPRDYMLSKKAEFDYPLYYETDTHWNNAGTYMAYSLLKEKIEAVFPETVFPEIDYEISVSESYHTGDILPMLKVSDAKSTQVSVLPVGHSNDDFYSYIKKTDIDFDDVKTKSADNTLPRALIYRDSFFVALEPFVSPLFSEAEYHWKRFEITDREYVLNYKPDIIIFETVERMLPDIIKK